MKAISRLIILLLLSSCATASYYTEKEQAFLDKYDTICYKNQIYVGLDVGVWFPVVRDSGAPLRCY